MEFPKDIEMYRAYLTGVFTIFVVVILSWPKSPKDESESKAPIKFVEIKKGKKSPLSEFKRYRKHFLVYGFPIGTILGITTHIPFIFDLAKTPQLKFIDLIIQFGGVLFFLTFTLTMTLYRIYVTIKHTEDHEARKGITDGILISFFLIQTLLFFSGYYEIFIPELGTFFHHK